MIGAMFATRIAPVVTVLATLAAPAAAEDAPPTVVLVQGAPGAPEYAARFSETTTRWQKAAARAHATVFMVGKDNDRARPGDDKSRLAAELAALARVPGGPVWLVLIGHGTFDGRHARFNLRGPDVSAEELARQLAPLKRPLVVVNGAAASGPFAKALAGPDRIVVTATKSGGEASAPRFGAFFAEAIADPRADLDRDGTVSVLEAFLQASKRTEASFSEEGLLASEHALLEDNGDGLGTPATLFRGLRPTSAAGGVPTDGTRAGATSLLPAPPELALPPALRRRRDELETALFALRDQRPRLGDAAYFARLERLLLELARLYQKAGQLVRDP